jgi:ubiquinol-cytochrome c reductase cytochrome b subunit
MNSLLTWFEDRTGARKLLHEALYERIPGGARWRYVWGSTLVLAFVTQAITGIFLWMAYSPSTQTAWESVYYIQYEMQGGWLLRGIHHFMAQAMVVLLAIHLMQVVIDGAYRAPREINFWIGLLLALIVLGLSLTGYLLPWDQKGYWATNVATNLSAFSPAGTGEPLQKIAVGGADYGHHTLTRFFAMHAGVLPAALVGLLVVHVALFRKHGIHATKPDAKPATTFWPDQVLRDAVACLAVLAVVLGLVVWKGAELGAPADPASPYSAARPEWYFLFLFQFLKYFTGSTEAIGAIYAPGLVMAVLFLMPIIGRWKLGHRFNILFLCVLLLGAGLLTWQALDDDYYAQWHEYEEDKYPEGSDERKAYDAKFEASRTYLAAVEAAHEEAERVVELASSPSKIPPTGAVTLLRGDAKLRGPRLFTKHCGSCHNYQHTRGDDASRDIVNEAPSAPNLFGFGGRDWVAGLLDPERIISRHNFGYQSYAEDGTPRESPLLGGQMVGFVNDTIRDADVADVAEIQQEVAQVVAALSAQAALPAQEELDAKDQAAITAGLEIIRGNEGSLSCIDCHKFGDDGDLGMAPDLTGYASRRWIIDFVRDPAHNRFYGDAESDHDPPNDRMPAFGQQFDDKTLGLIADWLRGDWYEPEADEAEE